MPKYFQGWSLRVGLLIRLNLTADYDPPRNPEESVYTYPIFPFCLTPVVKPSLLPGRSLSTPLDNLGTQVSLYKYYKTILNKHKKQFSNGQNKCFLQLFP